jgi:hypothetical protein
MIGSADGCVTGMLLMAATPTAPSVLPGRIRNSCTGDTCRISALMKHDIIEKILAMALL